MSERPDQDLPGVLQESLDRFVMEVVRWNRSINLVSRRKPEGRARELLTEAVSAWRAVTGSWSDLWKGSPPARWIYLDLGSGGGFPGIPWSLLFQRAPWSGARPDGCWLVEPRLKRVAFLERQVRLLGLEDTAVLPRAWPSLPDSAGDRILSSPAVLVTRKALDLADREIRRPWDRQDSGTGGRRIVSLHFNRCGQVNGEPERVLAVPGMDTVLRISLLLP